MSIYNCSNCEDILWVCENHHNVPWSGMSDHQCCGGAGSPCKECNESDYENPPRMPEGFIPLVTSENGRLN